LGLCCIIGFMKIELLFIFFTHNFNSCYLSCFLIVLLKVKLSTESSPWYFYYKPKYACCRGDYPFNDNLSSCTNLFGKWKGRTWRSKVFMRIQSLEVGETRSRVSQKVPLSHKFVTWIQIIVIILSFIIHKNTHKEWVALAMRNKGRKEWAFPIHGHHNGSKLSYSLKLANNQKQKHLSFGIVYLHKGCKGGEVGSGVWQ